MTKDDVMTLHPMNDSVMPMAFTPPPITKAKSKSNRTRHALYAVTAVAAVWIGVIAVGSRSGPAPIAATTTPPPPTMATSRTEISSADVPSGPSEDPTTQFEFPPNPSTPPTAAQVTTSEQLTKRAESELASGKLAEARTHFHAASRMNPKYVPARLGEADAVWRLGERTEARALYQKILVEVPSTMIPASARERANPTRD